MDLKRRLKGFWDLWSLFFVLSNLSYVVVVIGFVLLDKEARYRVFSDYGDMLIISYFGGIEFLVDPENAERVRKNFSEKYD